MDGPPDITAYEELLEPVDVEGPTTFIYAYKPENNKGSARELLAELREKKKGRLGPYISGMRMVGLKGHAPWDKWHMLDPTEVPKGIAKDAKGQALSLKDMGEFKNIAHKSRILHYREGNLIVLLTAYRGKKENELTVDAINPALYAREEFLRRRQELLARWGRK